MDLLSAVADMGDAARMVTGVGGEVIRRAPAAGEPPVLEAAADGAPAAADIESGRDALATAPTMRTTAGSLAAIGGVRPRTDAVGRESRTAGFSAEPHAEEAAAGPEPADEDAAAPAPAATVQPEQQPAEPETARVEAEAATAAEAAVEAGPEPEQEDDQGWVLHCGCRSSVLFAKELQKQVDIDPLGINTLEHLEFVVQAQLDLPHALHIEVFNDQFGAWLRPPRLALVPRDGRVQLVPVDSNLEAAEGSLLDQGLDLLRGSMSANTGGMKLSSMIGGSGLVGKAHGTCRRRQAWQRRRR